MKKNPIIGIIPLIDYSKDSYWMVPGYVNGLKKAGALPIILPIINTDTEAEMLADMCDGFLFTGGQDVDPEIYSEKKSELCGECCPERDVMEKLLLDVGMKRDKPIPRHMQRYSVYKCCFRRYTVAGYSKTVFR